MKTSRMRVICAAIAASLFVLGCSSAPTEGVESKSSALHQDTGGDPDPDPPDSTPPPPPPPPPAPTVTCTNQLHDGVCDRYCCTETAASKQCGVLPCKNWLPIDPHDVTLVEF